MSSSTGFGVTMLVIYSVARMMMSGAGSVPVMRRSSSVDHPGKVGGSDTWEDSESWQHRRSTPTSCVNAR